MGSGAKSPPSDHLRVNQREHIRDPAVTDRGH
jgi:hypothetical protein